MKVPYVMCIRLYEVSRLYGTHSGDITTLFRSISYSAENILLYNYILDYGLQCTKVSKFNSACCGTYILFFIIPHKLNELQNVSCYIYVVGTMTKKINGIAV